jgi:hypothetical protein
MKGDAMHNAIIKMFKQCKKYQAELKQFVLLNRINPNGVDAIRATELFAMYIKLGIVSICMLVLCEDEAYVVKRHLFDGVDWIKIVYEYTKLWGEENSRTERTLEQIAWLWNASSGLFPPSRVAAPD